jgi:Na+-driven multidrug efflux pump
VTATLVSKANAKGNQEDVQDAISQALIVGFCISLVGTALMMLYPDKVRDRYENYSDVYQQQYSSSICFFYMKGSIYGVERRFASTSIRTALLVH